jgi:hypothetical protein
MSPGEMGNLLSELNIPHDIMHPIENTCVSFGMPSCIDFFVGHPQVRALCTPPPMSCQRPTKPTCPCRDEHHD